jgi:hypothetical protein
MNKHALSEPRTLPFELWGGLEYTVNRVQDEYFNQLQWSEHATRPDDLDLFAQLGFQALRYPVLWETVAHESLDRADWSWTDVRLNRIRALGMNTIAGLVHHRSGPRWHFVLTYLGFFFTLPSSPCTCWECRGCRVVSRFMRRNISY